MGKKTKKSTRPTLGDKIDDITHDRATGYYYIGFSSYARMEEFLKWALNKSHSSPSS